MTNSIKEITKLAVADLDETMAFRAYMQLSVFHFEKAMDNGYTFRVDLKPLGKIVDHKSIRADLQSHVASTLPKLSLQHTLTVFEAWIFDIFRAILAKPERLNRKRKLDVATIVESQSRAEILASIVEAELNDIRYRKVSEWFECLGGYVSLKVPTADEVETISEIKASRDILIHNQEIVNEIYLSKSGSKARAKIGERLDYSHDYALAAWGVLRKAVEETGEAISKKIDA